MIPAGKGTVSFHNTAMDINFKQAKIGELEAERVRVAIPNLMRSELEVEASARSSADLLLSTLVELPPLTGLAELKRATQKLLGSVDSEFSMRLPLYRGAIRQADINASGKLRDLTWELPVWNLSFSALNGDLAVVNQQITSPRTLMRGPPLLPGLMAASTWTTRCWSIPL